MVPVLPGNGSDRSHDQFSARTSSYTSALCMLIAVVVLPVATVATVAQDHAKMGYRGSPLLRKLQGPPITGGFCEFRGEKVIKQREARKAKEALQRDHILVPFGLFV